MSTPSPTQPATSDELAATNALVGEDLIEEVSIDGMCGVY